MKKILVLAAATAIIFSACKSHGPLCPAYSSVKKAPASATATASVLKSKGC